MKRLHETGSTKKSVKLGRGQTLETPHGRLGEDQQYSSTKMGGGMDNLSDTLPGYKGKVNEDDDD